MKYTIEYARELFGKEGYTLITDKYVSSKHKLDYVSPSGYSGSITFGKWLAGQRHVKENKRYYNIEKVRTIVEKDGFSLVSKTYKGSKEKIYYKCGKCGTVNSVVWNQWYIRKNKCSGCIKAVKLKTFKSLVGLDGYTYKDGSYQNNRSYIELECDNKHKYITNRFNWVTNGSRCPICSCVGKSKPEKEIIELLEGTNLVCTHTDRSIIAPYELDIVVPEKKIAIEYCGLYWHSESMGKDRNYHLSKLNLCTDRGYRLITIFEDEWINKRDIVESRLVNLLCENKLYKIYARKCTIKEITAADARNFCEDNHLQGYTGARIKLGAFYNNELVSVMTFSKPSISKGGNPNQDCVWELSRFCSKINYRVIGIASKLLKYFERNYTWNVIFSYADRRWSFGNVYEKIGFKLSSFTQPNYWYFNDTDLRLNRVHRFVLRKKPNEPKNISEYNTRLSQGYYRIWDCGNIKYELYNKQGTENV